MMGLLFPIDTFYFLSAEEQLKTGLPVSGTGQGDGSYLDELKQLAKCQVLVIDDFCLDVLDRSNCLILYDILGDCYRSSATIITGQLQVSTWHSQLQDQTLADSIMDRLAHTPY